MPHFTPYILLTLLSAAVILVMGGVLLFVSAPREPELKNYRLSRRFLAAAYLILAATGLWEVFGGNEPGGGALVQAFTVIVASYQSLLFTFSTITLINTRYITAGRVLANLVPISLLAAGLLAVLFAAPARVFKPVFYAALALYCLQLVYYVALFGREYRTCRRRFDDFFSGDEYRRLLWVRGAFYMAAGVGVVAVASLFASENMYILFTAAYTVFYIYFCVKFINYITLFHRIAPAVSVSAPVPVPGQEAGRKKATTARDIDRAIEKWLDANGHLSPDVTLDDLAARLGINRTYLSAHINSSKGMRFREWIGTLRIREAQRMIQADPGMPLSDVAEAVGISTLSSFSRQFTKVAGVTPGRFRQDARREAAR